MIALKQQPLPAVGPASDQECLAPQPLHQAQIKDEPMSAMMLEIVLKIHNIFGLKFLV